jgi:GT2 family glycosyltransferase
MNVTLQEYSRQFRPRRLDPNRPAPDVDKVYCARVSLIIAQLVDVDWYLEQNPDIIAVGLDPSLHYVAFGAREGRNPNPLFFSDWYKEQYPHALNSGVNPLQDYVQSGATAGRNPNPFFDSLFYLEQNSDLVRAKINPLEHYLKVGALEGRDPHPLFRSTWYLQQNPEVAGLNPLAHYLNWGARFGLSPHPLFDVEWYLSRNPEVAEGGLCALEDYLTRGARQGRSPHPLFDAQWYLRNNPDVARMEQHPLEHYLRYGGREGRDPHPLFSSGWYLAENRDVAEAGLNPLLHYVVDGAKESRSPHPLFDSNFYRSQLPGGGAQCENPLRHYLSAGWKQGLKPHPQFDPDFYLRAYPDVREAGLEPLTDYVVEGRSKSRLPSADGINFETYRPGFEIPREPQKPPLPAEPAVKAIAFYLPQFHQTQENDAWWGKGFTEWTSVRRGTPNFEGHYQPHVPSTLGYYDLGGGDVLQKQAELARSHGIFGFCFYFYWFGGKVLLDLPIRHMAEKGEPDFPFCLCWANENWTRRWDGRDGDVLISQNHSPEDDLGFIKRIEPMLLKKNYIRVGGKPMLLVYRPSLFPDPAATAERWRTYFRRRGHGELHLAMVRSFSEFKSEFYGFDAVVQFPPHCHATPITSLVRGVDPAFRGYIYDYSEIRRKFLDEIRHVPPGLVAYPGVMPSWDNTPRQLSRSTIWLNSCPEAYFEWLSAATELVRARPKADDRFLFINAWNEWAEGCHLEPDEKFGYAWLNATSLALAVTAPEAADPISDPLAAFPDPPVQEPVTVPPLPASLKLTISVLFYHREDIIPSFLRTLLPQIEAVSPDQGTAVELYLAFNYKPTATLQDEIRALIAELLPDSSNQVHLVENGFNVGFGAGHNAVFARAKSDIFLMLNSDVRIAEREWLALFVERFHASGAAIIGPAATASRLGEEGFGIPISPGELDFDFVDGSVLAIRSDVARRYGLFSDAFDYVYFEDADLCLRYRQLGLRLDLIELPHEHERYSSSQVLPRYAMENVLNRNRARFFSRWGHYLKTRELPNRLAVRFLNLDRQLQCASLPALFGLLSEHPGAVIDLAGVNQQLAPLFRHPNLRLIPWWQTFRETDYLRCNEIAESATKGETSVAAIATRLGCIPDLEAARAHLRSLVRREKGASPQGAGDALLFVPRMEPLFEGRQPRPDSFSRLRTVLAESGWQVSLLTDLGKFELERYPTFAKQEVTHVGVASGLDILKIIVASDLVVSCDNWISELGQLLDKKTFVWLGATSPAHSLWNLDKVGFFNDSALPCLGCYQNFGRNNRNICLRGDIACMRDELGDEFLAACQRFIDGEQATAARWERNRWLPSAGSSAPPALTLDAWPPSQASSVLVLIPVNPKLDQAVVARAREMAEHAVRGMDGCRIVLDDEGVSPPRGVPHPTRQNAMAAIRQAMVDRHLKDERWVFWADADIVAYPPHLIDELIHRAEGGIAAPLVLMEGNVSEPLSNKFGFGPGRFYDIAGFVENGRWARFSQPFFDQLGPVYELDSVGSCYLVNADLYRQGAKHEVDVASRKFLKGGGAWPQDSIFQNQLSTANSFSEHYSVCEFARQARLPVRAFADLIARHQKPPSE